MLPADARSLIENAVQRRVEVWADLGAGEGTFTRALASLLEPGSRIYAVDVDASALKWTKHDPETKDVAIIPVVENFAREFETEEPGQFLLDGILFANSLHFVGAQAAVLSRLVNWLRPGGRVVIVEYDQRGASKWVPYPISIATLSSLARSAGLGEPEVVGMRPSEYQGVLYAAVMKKGVVSGEW